MNEPKSSSLNNWWTGLFSKKTPPATIVETQSPTKMTLEQAQNLVCYCFSVSKDSILNVANEHGLTTVAEISQHLNAGTHCGSCHPRIQALLINRADGTDNPPEVAKD